ncbi:cyclase family protein [Gluconobacter wancherniae]|uniref:cyclase family protein n=1 Tax=Gluconobacter wancherniae TaxID=1307955 RepID=UPI001B8C610E|nr:cyclase family protein [Gluconobacter wancherniae]MBS1089324.1 cyclase family protein [Gluconobacter wancherniae]
MVMNLGPGKWRKHVTVLMLVGALGSTGASVAHADPENLWSVYDQALAGAKYIDLTHTITPNMPVWTGFAPPVFRAAKADASVPPFGNKGQIFTYARSGFEATHYDLPTDQLGTQLDPPAHWAPEYPAIDEIPPTYSLRPLVVIQMQDQVAKDKGHQLQVSDIEAFEAKYGRIPEGSVVFVRSDWSRKWPDPSLTREERFPGVSLAALQFLHLKRHILFHGHEPLDTDDTPTLEGEEWLMHHGYAQAEGLANLDQVKPTGCLVSIGFAKFKGGTGGYARYIAVCPHDWKYGVTAAETVGPLPRSPHVLHWDRKAGVRLRE